MHRRHPIFAPAVFLAASCLVLRFSADGGIDPSEFQEDDTVHLEDLKDWPEADFPAPEIRGRAFAPGETFTYRAQWGIFRKAGTITISTDQPEGAEDGHLLVKTETESHGLIRAIYPMWLKAVTKLDTKLWRAVYNEVTGKARSDLTETETFFDYSEGVMHHEDKLNPDRNIDKSIPYPYPLDYASALLQIRGWDLEEGKAYPLLVSSKGKFYYVELEVRGIDEVQTPRGKVEALRLEPVKAFPKSKIFREGGSMSVWVSNDEDRIPVRFDLKTSIGIASMRIEDFKLSKRNSDLVAQR